MQEYLGNEITKLENYAAQQSESGEFIDPAQAGETTETGTGTNTVQDAATGATETEEVNIDDLSPEEAFYELGKTDLESAQSVLEDEIASIRAKAKEVRKQPAEKRSQKVEFVKQANMLEMEATRLETILNASKEKSTETANIPETKTEKAPETGQEGAVSQTETVSETEKSSQKEEPAPVVSEQKVETVAEEPQQESPLKGEPVEPAKDDAKLRISPKAQPEMEHKKNALNAVTKLSQEYGVPISVIHSSEVSGVVGAVAAKKGVIPVAFYHNGVAYIIVDKITSVSLRLNQPGW